MRVNISNIDDGTFKINFLNKWGNWVQSNEIKSSETNIWNIRHAVYYTHYTHYGSDVEVEIIYYLANGTETLDSTLADHKTILIKARKLLAEPSSTNIVISKISTASTITAEKPIDV